MSSSSRCECGNAFAPGAKRCERCGREAPKPQQVDLSPLRVGEVLDGKWRLEGKLGVGGMGAVFLAQDLSLGRKVAIKVLAAGLCSDAEFVTRFEREARGTAQLEHPNIVPVHAVGRHRGRPFIVMKALEGVTLGKYLRARTQGGKRISREEILKLFGQLCAGLGFLHEKGFVHRDVKAGNVIVGGDGQVTLLDFGVLRDTSADRITRSGVLLGTPHYVAPEQLSGVSEVDGRADLYAVGVMLFECLTGRLPFDGDMMALIRAHMEQPAPDVCALVPGLPAGVGVVVRKALAKKPDERFATAQALYTALENAWPPASASRDDAIAEGAATLPATPFFSPAQMQQLQEAPLASSAPAAADRVDRDKSRRTPREGDPVATDPTRPPPAGANDPGRPGPAAKTISMRMKLNTLESQAATERVKAVAPQPEPKRVGTAEWEMVVEKSGVRRNRQILLGVVAVVLAILAGVGAWWLWGRP
jgi:serine/threonine protein kinase